MSEAGIEQQSVAALTDRAVRSLEVYCDPASRYAWPGYDLDLNPTNLTATDLLAPALLSYPIRGKYLEQLLQHQDEPNPYALLREAMEYVIATTDLAGDRFDALPAAALDDSSQPRWGAVLAAFDATRNCPGLTSVAVSKILHRKRPNLVPVIDSRVRTFYGADSTRELLQHIHRDLRNHGTLLDDWRAPYRLETGQPMSRLRALDIVIWMRDEPI